MRAARASGANGLKDRCPQDHCYDEGNTYVDPSGRRHCRACRRERTARARAGSVDVTTSLATLVARVVVTHQGLADRLAAHATEREDYRTECRWGWDALNEQRDLLVEECVGEGMSRRAIAECLDVSHTTVLNIISGYGGDELDELEDD